MTIQRSSGRRLIWTMSMDNGVRCLAGPWYQFLMDNNLMAGDEVAFYFRPNQHVWELILRKQLIWDDEGQSDWRTQSTAQYNLFDPFLLNLFYFVSFDEPE